MQILVWILRLLGMLPGMVTCQLATPSLAQHLLICCHWMSTQIGWTSLQPSGSAIYILRIAHWRYRQLLLGFFHPSARFSRLASGVGKPHETIKLFFSANTVGCSTVTAHLPTPSNVKQFLHYPIIHSINFASVLLGKLIYHFGFLKRK